ncbi:hypothetical protein EVAR_87590_1 [Eumeta japonica]|uniref:Reverse transcriptase domain-containing protein n=1 Tax=Eumeta variegata TaxID=151549 RepID=A0A4C1WQ25_EUMVA|nr:hypothetical protein EVAR_87590_1 [Eumeta japonica]
MDELSANASCFLYADDQIILAPSPCGLQDGEKVEQVKEFVYLGSLFTNDGKHDRNIKRRVNAGNKMNGALLAIMNSKSILLQARLTNHNGVLILTLMSGIESCVWWKKNESGINAVEMRSLRNMCGVFQKGRCRNSAARERCGLKEDVMIRVERGMLRCLAIWERKNESRLTKQIYRANMCDGKVGKGRPRKFYARNKSVLNRKFKELAIRPPTSLDLTDYE